MTLDRQPSTKYQQGRPCQPSPSCGAVQEACPLEVPQLGTSAIGHVCLRLPSSRFGQNDTPPRMEGNRLWESSDALAGPLSPLPCPIPRRKEVSERRAKLGCQPGFLPWCVAFPRRKDTALRTDLSGGCCSAKNEFPFATIAQGVAASGICRGSLGLGETRSRQALSAGLVVSGTNEV